ncbi:MAG: ribose 5-phosphate isomerase B [Candidatus Omnitrophota bacterium]
MSTLLIASDHAGFVLKERLKGYAARRGIKVEDLGAYSRERCDYPLLAAALARAISTKGRLKGILICKSGIGNSIVANRFPGVRAALCYNVRAALLSRRHNDSNILVLGAGFVTVALAKKIVAAWLRTPFEGGRHLRRLKQIEKIEKAIKGA